MSRDIVCMHVNSITEAHKFISVHTVTKSVWSHGHFTGGLIGHFDINDHVIVDTHLQHKIAVGFTHSDVVSKGAVLECCHFEVGFMGHIEFDTSATAFFAEE